MPRSTLSFGSEIFIDPTMYPHTNIRSKVFLLHFLGHVLIGREQPYYCRRPSAPGAICTSPATCFSTRPVGHYCWKNREYYSILTHFIMEFMVGTYNGKTTLNVNIVYTTMLVWSLPVHLHQALTQISSPSPGLCATILHYYDNLLFSWHWGSARSSSRRWGYIASKTEKHSSWYAIPGTWCIAWLLLCCCRCL